VLDGSVGDGTREGSMAGGRACDADARERARSTVRARRGAGLALGQTGRYARKAQARAWALERKRKRAKEADCGKKKASRPGQMRRLSQKSSTSDWRMGSDYRRAPIYISRCVWIWEGGSVFAGTGAFCCPYQRFLQYAAYVYRYLLRANPSPVVI
jgi:hypothetical protein